MILVRDIFSKLKIKLSFSKIQIKGNRGTYEGCMAQLKDITKIKLNASSDWLKKEAFWNEELWERKNVPDSTLFTHHILDSHYEKCGQHYVVVEIHFLT